MRQFENIPQEEFDARKMRMNKLSKELYCNILSEKIRELVSNPDNIENVIEFGETKTVMKNEIKTEFDRINEEIKLFKRNMYPELSIDIQDNEKLEIIENLKKEAEYIKLKNGINYYSQELKSDEKALEEIGNLNKQITVLITEKFPDLFA